MTVSKYIFILGAIVLGINNANAIESVCYPPLNSGPAVERFWCPPAEPACREEYYAQRDASINPRPMTEVNVSSKVFEGNHTYVKLIPQEIMMGGYNDFVIVTYLVNFDATSPCRPFSVYLSLMDDEGYEFDSRYVGWCVASALGNFTLRGGFKILLTDYARINNAHINLYGY